MPSVTVHNLLLVPGAYKGDLESLRESMSVDMIEFMNEVKVTKVISEWSEKDLKRIILAISVDLTPADRKGVSELLKTEPVEKAPKDFKVIVAPSSEEACKKALEVYCFLSGEQENVPFEYDPPVLEETEPEFGFLGLHYDISAVSERIKTGPHGLIPEQLQTEVSQSGCVPEKFWYWDEESATLWKKLSLPGSGYNLVIETTKLIESYAHNVVRAVFEKNCRADRIDLVDLGVGTPDKDEILLTAIAQNSQPGSQIRFFPIDISFPLLELTLRRILLIKQEFRPFEERNISIRLKPLIGDFECLGHARYQTFLEARNPRLFCLLGNTLGNLLETQMMDCLATIMEEGDFLLIDVESVDGAKDSELVQQYKTEAMYDFVFHPLWLLEETLKKLEKGKSFAASMRVDVVDKEVSYKFWSRDEEGKTSKKRGWRIKKALTNIPGSKVVAMFHMEDNQRRLLMAWSTKYKRSGLETFLKQWFIVDKNRIWMKDRYALYLLEKKT